MSDKVKVSARIAPALFQQLEDERHRLSRAKGKRLSSRAMIEAALVQYLTTSTVSHPEPGEASSEPRR